MLLRKIGWLCQSVRVMIVVLLAWLLVKTGIYWTSDDKIIDLTRFTLHMDVRAGSGCLNSFPRMISGVPPGFVR